MTPHSMNRLLWGSVLVLVILTLGGLFFANKKLTNLANNTAELRAESEINRKKITIYQASRQKVHDLDYVEDLAQQILPAKHDQSATIAELSQFALRSNLSVADITFDIPDASTSSAAKKSKNNKDENTKSLPKGVDLVPITLTLQSGARYEDVLDFLETIEKNQRRMQIINISLTPTETDGSTLEQASLRINIYIQASKDKRGKINNED